MVVLLMKSVFVGVRTGNCGWQRFLIINSEVNNIYTANESLDRFRHRTFFSREISCKN